MMRGRLEVLRLRARLDAVFSRVSTISDLETKAHFARYLCVLVSGYLERSVVALAREHVRARSAPSVQRHVGHGLQFFQNPTRQRVVAFVTTFDEDWGKRAETFIVGERAEALDAIVARRNQIAHGDDAGISFAQVSDYYVLVNVVVDFLVELFDPPASGEA